MPDVPGVLLETFDIIADDGRSVTVSFSTPDYASFVILPATSTAGDIEHSLAKQIAFGTTIRAELAHDARIGYPNISFKHGIDAVARSAKGSIAILALDDTTCVSVASIAAIRATLSTDRSLIVVTHSADAGEWVKGAGVEVFSVGRDDASPVRDALIQRLGQDVVMPRKATFKVKRPPTDSSS